MNNIIQRGNLEENNSLKNRYVKMWLVSLFILSVIYLFACYLIDKNTLYVQRFSDSHHSIFRSLTPNYPPPLRNFMD